MKRRLVIDVEVEDANEYWHMLHRLLFTAGDLLNALPGITVLRSVNQPLEE